MRDAWIEVPPDQMAGCELRGWHVVAATGTRPHTRSLIHQIKRGSGSERTTRLAVAATNVVVCQDEFRNWPTSRSSEDQRSR